MILRKQLVAAGLAALVAAGTVIALPTQTAQAQADQYERVLAGIRLNSKATSVLRAYGNPNDVVVGDVGIREAPGGGQGGTQAGAGGGGLGAPGGGLGAPGGMGSSGGMRPGGGGMSAGMGGPPAGYGGPSGPPAGFGGPPAGYGGPSGPPAGFGGAGEDGGRGGGFPGGGFPGAGGGGSTGQFGQTVSNLTPQQETTWIYNRKAGRDVVSYEFLVGQGGAVTQIRTIGYSGGNIKTKKGVRLGTSYKDVVLRYGVPEEQFRVGRSLIASYKRKNHVLFQFLNQRGQQENPYSAGNKVIAITIASVE